MKKFKTEDIVNGVTFGGVVGLILNGIKQYNLTKENPEREFDLMSFITYGAIGGIIGGISVPVLNFIISVFDSEEKIITNKDEINYLLSVIGSYEPDEKDLKIYKKGYKIKNAINHRYEYSLLGKATNQGSVAQGTSLSGLSDLDILVKFKKTSFSSLNSMFNSIHDFFKYNFKDSELVNVRKQKVSIGLTFNIDGHYETIDVVPALRTDFKKGKNEYNLFKNPKLAIDSKKIKMNPHKQREFGNYEEEKKEVISLIKLLKEKQNLPIKSFLIKELTKKAFDENQVPNTLNEQLVMTLKFICNNIKTIKIKAPDNPSSVLTDLLSNKEKELIFTKLNMIINDIKNNSNNLQEYFPIKK
ncbi:hypothetical protein [Tenacibaculum maritimum]|uniref:hypothetical protein n=1 Tax=Tenacibaculum maritimum TaxID=107401 RepID=UPI0010A461F4|nr:hypothetical protein [Tenacibaculum maritimum]QCD62719.1 hypothetical protein B9C57_09360 [Tenacibaculum maritimum]